MKKIFILFLSLLFTNLLFGQDQDSLVIEEERSSGWKAFVADFGFNQYQGKNLPQLKNWGSRNVNLVLYRGMFIGRSKKLSIASGIGLGFDNYNFKNEALLIENRRDSFLYEFASVRDSDYVKSKLSVSYIDIPVEVHFESGKTPAKKWRFSAGAKIGFLLDAHSKVVYAPGGLETIKVKNKNLFGVESFRYGLIARAGFGYINFYGYYSLSELFRENSGPYATPFSFGISISPSYFLDLHKLRR